MGGLPRRHDGWSVVLMLVVGLVSGCSSGPGPGAAPVQSAADPVATITGTVTYLVAARLVSDGKTWFRTTGGVAVLTQGAPKDSVEVLLVRYSGS